MKIAIVIIYILLILLTFHQATYWGYGASSCPRDHVQAIEECVKLYYIWGCLFLGLIIAPLLWLLLSILLKIIKKITHSLNFLSKRQDPDKPNYPHGDVQ